MDWWQAASADRLRAGIEGSGGGGQAKIAMSRGFRSVAVNSVHKLQFFLHL